MNTVITESGHKVEISTGTATETAAHDGFGSFGKRPRGIAESAIREASDLLNRALKGNKRAGIEVEEAFATGDFTLAAFAAIDQEMVAQYEEQPSEWKQYTKVTTVRDFRPKHLRSVGRGTFGLSQVPELTEYPAVEGLASDDKTIRVGKFGNRYAIGFEAWKNDEAIDEIGDIPAWLARAAAETEAVVAVSNLVNASGVNTGFFNAGNSNAPTSLPLTLENLDTAIQAVRTRKAQVNGVERVVKAPALRLVVGPSSQTKAERILAIREIRQTTGNTETVHANYLAGSVTLVVDPALEVVNVSAKAAGTWFLLPDPNGAHPAVYAARLRGHETPEIRVKADTGQRVGGGSIPASDGSFEIDDIQYRVRHIFGGAALDPTFTYVSLGS